MAVSQEQSTASGPADGEQGAIGEAGGRSRLRRWCFRVVVLAGSLAVAVGLCEAALWIIAPVSFHEWLVWEAEGHIRARPMPNQVIHTAAGYPVRINKHGFRGPDYSFKRTPGTLRIAVFGGSAAFCYHAAGREKSWPGALEVKLSRRLGLPVEVINLGLPGFDAFNSKINYLCFGRAFDPDAIIVYHTWNDMKEFRSQETRPYRPKSWVPNKPLWQRVLRATQLGRRAREFYWTVTKRQLENRFVTDEGSGARTDRPIAPEAFEWERRNFVDFVTLADSDGVLPILVSQAGLGSPDGIDDPEIHRAMASSVSNVGMSLPRLVETWARVSAIIEEVAREHGALFVDGYNTVPHNLQNLRDHVHLHDAGSELLTEEIARVLVNEPRFLSVVNRVRDEAAISTARTSE